MGKSLSRTILLIVLISLLAGCKKADPNAAIYEALGYTPTFKTADCQFDVPAGYDVVCGYVTVPEDRSQPKGATLRLHTAIFKSTSPDPAPDPVVHLYGGPGGSLLDSAAFYLDAGGDDILKSRDYILFSQRGTRYAEPFLDCPGSTELAWEVAEKGLNYAEREARNVAFILACQKDLQAQGINLTAYNTIENAADVNDLRLALGYKQINLYGVSYGARLALTVLRDHPAAVRSAIIDSGYTMHVDINAEVALSAACAFDLIFTSCAADPACQSTYPDLETTFYRVVDMLNDNPVRVALSRGTVFIDGDNMMDLIFSSLYTIYGKDGVTQIPEMLTIADQDNLSDLAPAFEIMFAEDNFSEGMYYSIFCREEVSSDTQEVASALAADLPEQIRAHYMSPALPAICEMWEVGKEEASEKEPVVSDIPVLVLTGQYDPITPPAYNKTIAETLSNSFFYEIPGIGHGAMRGSACALDIGLQFLENPTTEPDASCVNQK